MPNEKDNKGQLPSPQNGMTRRDALKTAAAVGATAALAGTLPIKSAVAAKKGGHFKVALNGASATDSLDPVTYATQYLSIVGYFWGNALVRLDANQQIHPELAESWDTSDAKTWVFKMRKGIEFHNGKEATASDMVWTINRHRAEDAASALKPILGQMVELKASGSHEITFVLENPNADWPYVLTNYHLQIQPEGDPTDRGISTGPYQYENFDPGVRLSLKRNPNYWKSDHAHFDSVEVLAINDPGARVSALQTGDVHLINAVAPKVAKLLESKFTINRVDSTWFSEFVLQTDVAPFDDNHMRLALKYAVDRQEIIDRVMLGAGVVANDHPVPASFRFHPAGLEQKAYDPDKAKFHYKKAGNPAVPPLHTSNIAFNGAVETAELYQQQATKAGIDFEVRRSPDDGYWSNVWNVAPFCAASWFGRPTEDQILTAMFTSDSVFNAAHFKRPSIDKKLLEARKELDQAKRKQIYGELLTEVSTEGGDIIPTFQQLLFGTSKDVAGFYTSPGVDGNFVELMHFTS